jgi:hypothetical protein
VTQNTKKKGTKLYHIVQFGQFLIEAGHFTLKQGWPKFPWFVGIALSFFASTSKFLALRTDNFISNVIKTITTWQVS